MQINIRVPLLQLYFTCTLSNYMVTGGERLCRYCKHVLPYPEIFWYLFRRRKSATPDTVWKNPLKSSKDVTRDTLFFLQKTTVKDQALICCPTHFFTYILYMPHPREFIVWFTNTEQWSLQYFPVLQLINTLCVTYLKGGWITPVTQIFLLL